jgi:hypothetical protein
MSTKCVHPINYFGQASGHGMIQRPDYALWPKVMCQLYSIIIHIYPILSYPIPQMLDMGLEFGTDWHVWKEHIHKDIQKLAVSSMRPAPTADRPVPMLLCHVFILCRLHIQDSLFILPCCSKECPQITDPSSS